MHAEAPALGLGPYRLRDYDRLPDQPRRELVFGRLYVTPSPFAPHQVVSDVLEAHFDRIASAAGGFRFHAPFDVVLADHSVVQPDVMYLSATRLEIVGNRVEGPPDLVVEILSPGTARMDRGQKLDLYAIYGVREYWLVSLGRRQVEFLVNQAGHFAAAPSDAGTYRSVVVPEVHLDLAKFWRAVDRRLRRLPRHSKR
ncbi:MAG TPA: Uma2 family endonuclease [Thermoanaerobaculia bacterium]|jgi:Uma2 family endonuclease|nr:Uma2 family endonuclease [Thermoanaerobaculia bacterium]